MRHRSRGFKLHVSSPHRRALVANLLTSLFGHERIRTTLLKAKALSQEADKMITLAKRQDLHARRQAAGVIRDKVVLKKLFDDISKRYNNRKGGYTRVLKLSGFRHGDGATLALIELTERALPKVEDTAPKQDKKETGKSEKKVKTPFVKKSEEKPKKTAKSKVASSQA